MQTPANGNGYTVKDVVTRVEGKVDAFIIVSQTQHTELLATIQNIQLGMALHAADGHPMTVKELSEKQIKEDGRRDMLRILFGTSLLGLLCGAASLFVVAIRVITGS